MQPCTQSHYAAIVEAAKDVEIYQLGDADCPYCLRLMASKHEQIAKIFRDRIATLEASMLIRLTPNTEASS